MFVNHNLEGGGSVSYLDQPASCGITSGPKLGKKKMKKLTKYHGLTSACIQHTVHKVSTFLGSTPHRDLEKKHHLVILNTLDDVLVEIVEKLSGQHFRTGCGPGL